MLFLFFCFIRLFQHLYLFCILNLNILQHNHYLFRKDSIFEPKLKLNLISDIDDNMILELAVECSANFIITGNSNDFTFSEYKQTKILSPKEYWENYASI